MSSMQNNRLTVGDFLPEFVYDTPFAKGVSFRETCGKVPGKTALVFLRYYGCTLCQLDLHSYAAAYDAIRQTGGQLLVVLQSDPENLANQLTPESLPFEIICDPQQELYRRFCVGAAPSMLRMMSPATVAKGIRAMAGGYKHGEYEGNELQLPAVFVTRRDGCLAYVRYGTATGDAPTPKELLAALG